MQKYGKHTEEVMEVVDFVRSGGILKTEFQQDQFNEFEVEVINTLSYDEALIYYDTDYPGAKIKEYMWSEIVRNYSITSSDRDVSEDEFDNIILPLVDDLSRELSDEITEHLEDLEDERYISVNDTFVSAICDFFYIIIRERSGAGIIANSMGEKLFKLYQASGYPVGWSGEYPDGKLVVYSK